ncbi:MAG: hypothetical protein V1735_04325 [Nanoarchaeota archaeon]
MQPTDLGIRVLEQKCGEAWNDSKLHGLILIESMTGGSRGAGAATLGRAFTEFAIKTLRPADADEGWFPATAWLPLLLFYEHVVENHMTSNQRVRRASHRDDPSNAHNHHLDDEAFNLLQDYLLKAGLITDSEDAEPYWV